MMWIGYDSPVTERDTEVSIEDASFLTPTDGLIDGRPGTQTLVEWGGETECKIILEFGRTFAPGVAVGVNITGLNATTNVTISWRRPGEGAESYQPKLVNPIQFPNGDIHAVAHWPAGLDPVEAVVFNFSDATMEQGDVFTIGEVFAGPAIRTKATIQDFQDAIISRTASSYSPTGQPTLRIAKNAREVNLRLRPEQLDTAYGATQDALNRIADNPLVFVTVADDAPELDAGEGTKRLSMYGAADFGPRGFVPESRLVDTRLTLREIR